MEGGERKRKRRRISGESPPQSSRWTSKFERRIYSTRLLHALRRTRRPSAAKSRAVREAADRSLAFSARCRTRWSRAILLASRRAAAARLKAAAGQRPRRPLVRSAPQGGVEPLRRKARVLGSLVSGCRKLPLPALLDETSDYIASLQMQVRAMTMLADALSSLGGGGYQAVALPSSPPPAG